MPTFKQSLNHTSYYRCEFDSVERFKKWSKKDLYDWMIGRGHRMHSNITKPEMIYQVVKNFRGGWCKRTNSWEN